MTRDANWDPKSFPTKGWDSQVIVGNDLGPQSIRWIWTRSTESFPTTEWDSHFIIGNDMGLPRQLWEPPGIPNPVGSPHGTPSWNLGTTRDSRVLVGTVLGVPSCGRDSHLAFGTPILRAGLPLLLWERGWIPAYLLGTIWDSRFVPNDTLGVPMSRWERHGTTMMALGIPARSQSQIGTPISMLGPTGSPIPFPTEHWESQLFLGTPVGIPIRFRFSVWDPSVR